MSDKEFHVADEREKIPEEIVYVIDDDEDIRSILLSLFKRRGISCKTYNSAEDFLDVFPLGGVGCILLDLKMDGMNGLELQARLRTLKCPFPIIFLTGNASVSAAVEAVRTGAFDFLEKPFENNKLVRLVEAALETCRNKINHQKRFDILTLREREVFDLIVLGKTNKGVADDLGISLSTIEFHRANIMKKLNARSLEDLIALAR